MNLRSIILLGKGLKYMTTTIHLDKEELLDLIKNTDEAVKKRNKTQKK